MTPRHFAEKLLVKINFLKRRFHFAGVTKELMEIYDALQILSLAISIKLHLIFTRDKLLTVIVNT